MSCTIQENSRGSALIGPIRKVGIDEAQFLGDGLVKVCMELADRGVRVIVGSQDSYDARCGQTGALHPSVYSVFSVVVIDEP